MYVKKNRADRPNYKYSLLMIGKPNNEGSMKQSSTLQPFVIEVMPMRRLVLHFGDKFVNVQEQYHHF